MFLNKQETQANSDNQQQIFLYFMQLTEALCDSSTIKTLHFSEQYYQELRRLLLEVKNYPFDSEEYEFIEPMDFYQGETLFKVEINYAINALLKYVRIAQELNTQQENQTQAKCS